MFIDKAKIYIKSGKGGNGIISFMRMKFIPKGGPDGGDGGDGGNIYIQGTSKQNSLINFKLKQHYKAESGQNGMSANKTGKNGTDLYIKVPIGTQIYTEDMKFLIYDCIDDKKFLILRGGKGGKGNAKFKSSINRTPYIKQNGQQGAEISVYLLLKTIADIGIIGKPNSGKSSLLAKITNANPKIASYPFSTLYPNIGTVKLYDRYYTIADIPGLIEDAHMGKGLGHRFLQHIERCNILLHLIDGTIENIENERRIILKELELYSIDMIKKKIITVINKSDLIDCKSDKYIYISALTGYNIDSLLREITDIMRLNS